MKYWILSSSSSGERLYKYSISGKSSTSEMYQHTHRTSEYKYEYISYNISTTERYRTEPSFSMTKYKCDYISDISRWTSNEYISEYIPEPEKTPYDFIPFKWRYARCMGEPYKGGKGYGKHGRGKNFRGNYSKRGNKKH